MLDQGARALQFRHLAVVHVNIRSAVGTEVASGVTAAVLGRVVDEGNSGILNTRVANITKLVSFRLTL